MSDSSKPLADLTFLVDSSLPSLVSSFRSSSSSGSASSDGIQDFLNLEKKTRLAADAKSTVRVVKELLSLLVEFSAWPQINELIQVLAKRRAQMQKVIETLVSEGLRILEQPAIERSEALRRPLLETLRTVSAGKIFVELERARLTAILAEMEEKSGNLAAAAEILQEVQVETIGTMESKEKCQFLLNQIRLCLAKRDYVRTEIIAKKVDIKAFNATGMSQLKDQFYRLQIAYYTHSGDYFPIAKSWREILNDSSLNPNGTENSAAYREAASNTILFGILSPFDSELSDFLQRLKSEKRLSGLGIFKHLLDQFCGNEIIAWPIKYEKELKSHNIFSGKMEGDEETAGSEEPAAASEESSALRQANRFSRWSDLRKRVVQHNLRVLSQYYSQIRSARLAQLLNLSEPEAERFLSDLVSSRQLFARIDRPTGIIQFKANQKETQLIQGWSDQINSLLTKVESTTHLINKENMIHKIK